jgi:LmbE family N-acetylglucosaminyl deacetylase
MPTGGLLAIFAHPDDETFGVGGSMAHYARRGHAVTMVCATRGEVGEITPGTGATPETLGQFREQELRDAMALLGVQDVRFLDFRDSGMFGTPENEHAGNLVNAKPESVVAPLVRVIRERQPDAVVTWDASGGYGHPDHIAIHEHATAAFDAAGDPSRYPDAGPPFSPPRLLYVAIPMEEFGRLMEQMREAGIETPDVAGEPRLAELPRVPVNVVIDVADHFEEKQQALLAHRTQLRDMEPFMKLPLEVRREFFGREYFHLARPALPDGASIDDLLPPA